MTDDVEVLAEHLLELGLVSQARRDVALAAARQLRARGWRLVGLPPSPSWRDRIAER